MPDMNMSAVASHAGFVVKYLLSNWSLDLVITLPFIILPTVLYFRGLNLAYREQREGKPLPLGADTQSVIMFLIGIFLLSLSFFTPIMYWSMVYLYMHMLIHVLVMIAVPPFIVGSKPWTLMHMGLPKHGVTVVGGLGRILGTGGPLYPLVRFVTNPLVSLLYFILIMWVWFYPPLMTYAVTNEYVMDLMHFTFITAGMGLFLQLIDNPPFPKRVKNPVIRLGMILVGTYSSFMLAMLLGLSSGPWFSVYLHIPGKTLSGMADQQIAASVLWVLCMEPFVYTAYYNIKLWMSQADAGEYDEPTPWLKRIRRPAVIPPGSQN